LSDHLRPHDAALARLQGLHPKAIDLSLGRVQRLCAALDHPEKRLPPVIHVAGTNGKGSTVAFIRAIAEAAGLSAHVYTSPHLVRFAERIRLNGRLISDDALARTLEEVERVNAGQPITFFEITAAAAFYAFASTPADLAIIEVGLGGRFDATNVIPAPKVAVIAPVDYDHREFLGDDLAGIAREKAGILKPGSVGVSARQAPAAAAAIAEEAKGAGVNMRWIGQDFDAQADGDQMLWRSEGVTFRTPRPGLLGDYQIANAGLAIAAVEALGDPRITAAAMGAGLRNVVWPARLQKLSAGPLAELAATADASLWLDGGHNPHAARALAAVAAEMGRDDPRPLVVIMGLLASKDARGVIEPFGPLKCRMIFTDFEASAAAKGADLAAVARAMGVQGETASDVQGEVASACVNGPARVLICGSLYLAGEVLALSPATWPD
jgi:dihydrofolate synthase/folylpolyglutamate synthase